MSLAQGGSGFPFFASCVFKYLRGDKIYDINVPLSEVPDPEVKAILEKVCVPLCECFAEIVANQFFLGSSCNSALTLTLSIYGK